jgi:glyceraldehyde 3-phosphate dehydrogenase
MPSKALEVNIASSRVDVTVDQRYEILKEVMKKYYGVREGLQTFLEELCHPYKNWEFIVKEARAYALNYFHVLKTHPKGPEAARLYADIFFQAIDSSQDEQVGINEDDYDPRMHKIISNASCTTTCLAHMVKPLLDFFGPTKILTASMATVHAVTGSQEVLDRLPKSGASDLRKNRSVMNNIILTTTGAANTLGLVIPEMKQIGFIAESVRIPTSTGSLIILVVNLQEEPSGESIRREVLNEVYRDAAARDPRGYLHYSEEQNVSSDIIGLPRAAAIIEGHETHTRTADVKIDLQKVCQVGGEESLSQIGQGIVRIAITQVVIYGWYDNELGSFVNLYGDRTVSVAEVM